jgi:hypothetical protein
MYGDNAIVPPEGVVGIISVKKHLRRIEIEEELKSLKNASIICRCKDRNKSDIRGPFLALVTMNSNISKNVEKEAELVFNIMAKLFPVKGTNRYDDMPGFIGSLSEWSIHKSQPKVECAGADYYLFKHKDDETHLGFQLLLTEILGVYYDETRNNIKKPGFTSFESGRTFDKYLGRIAFARIRGK